MFAGYVKRRRSSASGCLSSNDEGETGEGGGRSPLTPLADGESPSLRKQPRRCVKPRSYCDLLDYDSDLDIVGGSNSASPGRRRASGPRSQGGGRRRKGQLTGAPVLHIHQISSCVFF